MNFFITFCVLLVCVSLGEPSWFDFNSLTSPDTNTIGNDLFAGTYSQTMKHVTDVQNKIEDQDLNRFNSLPKYEPGTLGGIVTSLIGSVKNATGIIINGIRYTTSEVTRAIMETTANTGADLLLAQYKLVAGTTGVGTNLTLPKIESSGFGYEVSATGGYFSSLSSLEKNGRINVYIPDSGTIIIEIPMRFTQMQVGYEKITVTAAFFITLSGSFSIDIKNNSVSVKLRLGMDSTCAISVEDIKIELDGITVKLEGINSYLSSVTESVSNILISYMKDVISGQIQQAVNSTIKTVLNENSNKICSSFIPIQYTL